MRNSGLGRGRGSPRADRLTGGLLVYRVGFTLIEMIVVVFIIGILCKIAIPRINIPQFQVDAAARLSRIALQNAQRLAVTRQFDVVVSFDQTNNRIRVLEDANNNDVADAGERVTWKVFENGINFHLPPAAGVNGAVGAPIVGSSLRTIDGLPSVVFRRDGAASSDVELYMVTKRMQDSDYRAVTVLQSTGKTDWYKWLNGSWQVGNL